MTGDRTPPPAEWATCPTCGGTYVAGFDCVACREGNGVPKQRPVLRDGRQHGYESPSGLGRVLRIVFVAWMGLTAVSLTFDWALYRLVARIVDSPSSVSVEQIISNNDRQALMGNIILGCTIATGVVFMTGGWLVPILNFWRPKQIIEEIWRKVTPDGESREVPRLLHWWWGLWIVTGIVYGIVVYAAGDEITASGEALLFVALSTVDLINAVLAYRVVALLTSRHERYTQSIFDSLGQ